MKKQICDFKLGKSKNVGWNLSRFKESVETGCVLQEIMFQ